MNPVVTVIFPQDVHQRILDRMSKTAEVKPGPVDQRILDEAIRIGKREGKAAANKFLREKQGVSRVTRMGMVIDLVKRGLDALDHEERKKLDAIDIAERRKRKRVEQHDTKGS